MCPVETVATHPVFLGGIGPVPSRPAPRARAVAPKPAAPTARRFQATTVRDVRAVPLDELSALGAGVQQRVVPQKPKGEAPPVAAFESAL